MLEANRQLISNEEENRQGNQVGEQALDAANLENRLVHSSLLKRIPENKTADADDGKDKGPGTGCEQNYLCGIRNHLNPPSRNA